MTSMAETSEEIEARFLAAINDNPLDEDARLVYADWLEEQDDPRAEYLRLESQLWTLPRRITALQGQIDPAWLRSVSRVVDVYFVQSPNKIGSIKLVREVTGFGLKDAKDLVEAAPSLVKANLSPFDAKVLVKRFAEHGAIAEIRRRGAEVPSSLIDGLPHPLAVMVPTARLVLVGVGSLEDFDARRLALTAIRTITGRGLIDAQRILGAPLPLVLRDDLSVAEASAFRAQFAEVAIDLVVESRP